MTRLALLAFVLTLPVLLQSRPVRSQRQAEPLFKFSESMRMNVAHSREFSASFPGQPNAVSQQQSQVDYQNGDQPGGFVNWRQTLGQFLPNMAKFNANYNNNFGPGDVSSFGFGPLGLPVPAVDRAGGGAPAVPERPPTLATSAPFVPRTTQKPKVEDKSLLISEKMIPKPTPPRSGEPRRNSGSTERSKEETTRRSASTTAPQYVQAYWIF